MNKPEKGTYLVNPSSPHQYYLVTDEEPRNWKGSVEVVPLLPEGYGPAVLFSQEDIRECMPAGQFKAILMVGTGVAFKAA